MIECFCARNGCLECKRRAEAREKNRLKAPHLRGCGKHACLEDGDNHCWYCTKEGSAIYDLYFVCGFEGNH